MISQVYIKHLLSLIQRCYIITGLNYKGPMIPQVKELLTLIQGHRNITC